MAINLNFLGTGGIIEGNLGTSNVNINLDAALELDGSADYLKNSVADFRSSDSSGFVTAWVKSDDWNRGTQQHIFSVTDEATGNFYIRIFFNTDGKLYIKHMDSSVVYDLKSTNAVTDDGNWHHIAVGSTGTAIKMYIDGIEETVVVASGTNNGDWFADITSSKTDHVIVGALHDNAGVRSMFDGYIADVRYYSDTLTDAEILTLASKINANTPSIDNLQHWWKLNSTTIDSSNLGEDFGDATDLDLTPNSIVASNIHTDEYSVDVYDNSTTTDGTFTVTQGKVEGKALSSGLFDGDDDFVELGSQSGDLRLYNSDAAISLWFRPHDGDAGDSHKRILDKSNGGRAVGGYAILFHTDGTNGRISGYMDNVAVIANIEPTGGFVDNRFYHILWTWDGTNHNMYIDGVLEKTVASSARPPSDTTNMRIGSWNHSTA